MRRLLILACLLVAACGEPSAPPAPLPVQATNPAWFICDGIDAPALLYVEREGSGVRISEYDKPNGAIVSRLNYTLGARDGAAGSVTTPLLSDGAEAGAIGETNPGMLETPGAAYTPRITEVRQGERTIRCRWTPRTRLFGFTGRRSFVVHEDTDGDLIYTTYDFTGANAASPVELGDNGVTTTFSAEVRDGQEQLAPNGATYTFAAPDGISYVVSIANAEGRLEVRRDGAVIQTEPLIGFQSGDAATEP